ncbi:ABC transporter ATP-binding protein [Acidocella sp.]|uniref:ABC transporter ATP-binding protein n=1 Tax=Acidocella sp. TaxID=50710 RepID=UPI003D067FFB
MIVIEDVSVSFGGVKAIQNLNAVLRGEIVGVIGPNGAGKTTLLNVLSGFITPRSGRITAFGEALLPLAPNRRAIWGVRRSFQAEQVVDDLSAAENVLVMADSLKLSRVEKQAELARVFSYTGLSGREAVLGRHLNAYERRMVEIARALMGRPRIVLLDEPGAGLSQAEMDRLRGIILGIHAFSGAMTVLIDHDVDLITAVCGTTLVLDFGVPIACGATAAVLRDPKVQAAYLGTDEHLQEETLG